MSQKKSTKVMVSQRKVNGMSQKKSSMISIHVMYEIPKKEIKIDSSRFFQNFECLFSDCLVYVKHIHFFKDFDHFTNLISRLSKNMPTSNGKCHHTLIHDYKVKHHSILMMLWPILEDEEAMNDPQMSALEDRMFALERAIRNHDDYCWYSVM